MLAALTAFSKLTHGSSSSGGTLARYPGRERRDTQVSTRTTPGAIRRSAHLAVRLQNDGVARAVHALAHDGRPAVHGVSHGIVLARHADSSRTSLHRTLSTRRPTAPPHSSDIRASLLSFPYLSGQCCNDACSGSHECTCEGVGDRELLPRHVPVEWNGKASDPGGHNAQNHKI